MRLLRQLYAAAPPSALFVSGRSADHVVSVLRPCLDRTLEADRLASLRDSVRRRGGRDDDVTELERDWRRLQRLEAERAELTQQRAETAALGAELRRRPTLEHDGAERERLRRQGTAVKQALRRLQEPLWTVQEHVLPRLARLPNTVDPLTPDTDVLEEVPTSARPPVALPPPADPLWPDEVQPSDVSAGSYYLHGAAAACELALLDYFCHGLAAAGFVRLSCPDTVKSLVVDGCGLDFADPQQVARLASCHEGSADSPLGLHLVGGASLPAMCALLAKCRQPTAELPLRLVAAGRRYGPPGSGAAVPPQSAAVHHLTACTEATAAAEFDSSLHLLTAMVAALGPACRLRRVGAAGLARSESRRCELQLLTPAGHVTVAHVATHGDYISRRLHMAHAEPTRPDCQLLHVVEGCAVLAPLTLRALMQGGRRLTHWPAALSQFAYPGFGDVTTGT